MDKLRPICVCLMVLCVLYSSNVHAVPSTKNSSDLVTTSPDATFQKIIDILVNNNCIILAANQQLGLITFRNQSEDNSSSNRRHVNTLEGTILLRQEAPTSTRIRVKLTLRWQEIDRRGTNLAFGIQHDADAGWYKSVFDMLGFPPPSTNQ